jgi:hypothetical protein
MKDILDHEEIPKPVNFRMYRPLALFLEFGPLLIAFIGWTLNLPDLVVIGLSTAAMVYFATSWYLFKAEKFKVFDVIVAVVGGMGISVVLYGILFKLMYWPGEPEMVAIGYSTLLFCFAMSIINFLVKYFTVDLRYYEWRNSIKLLSRFMWLFILYQVMGLDKYLDSLF